MQFRRAWRSLVRRRRLDAEMDEEMRFHVAMQAERLARERGLDPVEARRQALVAFGGVEKYRAEGRDARGWRWIDTVSVDARLGARMLVKSPALSLVGGFAMAVAIAIGASAFELISEVLHPALPVEGGERIVALHYVTDGDERQRHVVHEYFEWREQLESVELLSAYRIVQRNLVASGAPPEPVKVAEISASTFDLVPTPPLAGRLLVPADERPGAPPVVLVGHRAWQTRFGGDAAIVGRMIQLGGVATTIAGVMPEGFAFPIDHQYWVPLQVSPAGYERLRGPELTLFGRLRPGAALVSAQAELAAIGQRLAATDRERYGRLRAEVVPFALEHVGITEPAFVWLLRMAQLLVGALAFVVAVNLAILVYARTVMRLGEIAVRTALGASRARILGQLFIESLTLSVLGAFVGLLLADVALSRMQALALANGGVPYWVRFDLSGGTIVYAVGVAAVAAVVMGVLPGLKVTGRGISPNLHELNGRTAPRLGAVWTTLVIAQVAAAVAVLPVAVFLAWQVAQLEMAGPGFAADRFMVGAMFTSDDGRPDPDRLRRLQHELSSRLLEEPGVIAVTSSASVPGFAAGRAVQFDEPQPTDMPGPHYVSTLSVAGDFFDVYEAVLRAGRTLAAGDAGTDTVVVNDSFVSLILGHRSPLGLRFRYGRDEAQTYQIVGVVKDFPSFPPGLAMDTQPVVYHAGAPGAMYPVILSVKFAGALPKAFADRFRILGADVDPALQLRRVVPLETFYNDLRSFWRTIAWALALVTASVLMLSAAGVYALMSFIVSQRTREIGIRAALGAHPRQLVLGVFGRATGQVFAGVITGAALAALMLSAAGFDASELLSLLVVVATLMLTVGAVAAAVPARRIIRLPVIDALRDDT